jgi:hypothetical protein
LLDAGHFGYGHQHEDKLNLLLHAYGRLLLTEAGNYAYDDSEMRRYVLSTRGHNTVRVDGEDQNRRLNYNRVAFDVRQPSDGSLKLTPAVDTAEGTYAEGYGPRADCAVTHARKVTLWKNGLDALGPFLAVDDRFTVTDAAIHRYQWLWHLNTAGAVIDGLTVASADPDQPNLAIIPAALPGLAPAVVTGQEAPEWQGWKAIKNHQQGEYAPTPTAIYECSAAGDLRQVTVLYPVRAGQSCPIQAVEAPRGAPIRLLLAGGQVIELPETA